MTPTYDTAEALWADWQTDLASNTPPPRYPVAPADSPLRRLHVGPQQVTLFGGAPGAGKTALVMQLATDALRLSPPLRVLVANVEMPPRALLERQLARLSNVPLADIRGRTTSGHAAELAAGLGHLRAIAPRLAFLSHPYTVEHLAAAADEFAADVVVVDYVQRFGIAGSHGSKKAEIDAIMSAARQFATAGAAVLLVAAVSRQRGSQGKTSYDRLNLASFRESSELEYGADDAFLLVPEKEPGEVTLRHAKCRNGEPADIPLRLVGATQRFEPRPTLLPPAAKKPVRGGAW